MKKNLRLLLIGICVICAVVIGAFYLTGYLAWHFGLAGFEVQNNEDSEKDIKSIPIHYKSSNANYRRDSFFIAATAWQFVDKEIYPFDSYKRNNKQLNLLKIDVDSIFYSPDSLKFFAFIISGYPEKDNNDTVAIYRYAGDQFIGFRKNKKDYWSVYDFNQYMPVGFKKYNSIRKMLRNYYLDDGEFKNDYRNYWNGKSPDDGGNYLGTISDSNRVRISFKYNIDNNLFWDSSVVWKKGACIIGYYCFQLEPESVQGDTNSVIKFPPLYYSDSVLKMFK